MTHLKKEGAISERVASLHTFSATDAQRFVNRIFMVGVFDKLAVDCTCWAKLIFCTRIQGIRLRLKVASAELTVATHGKSVNAFDG
jgi:hypothetical protein